MRSEPRRTRKSGEQQVPGQHGATGRTHRDTTRHSALAATTAVQPRNRAAESDGPEAGRPPAPRTPPARDGPRPNQHISLCFRRSVGLVSLMAHHPEATAPGQNLPTAPTWAEPSVVSGCFGASERVRTRSQVVHRRMLLHADRRARIPPWVVRARDWFELHPGRVTPERSRMRLSGQ